MNPTPSITGHLEKPTSADVLRSVRYTALFNTATAVLLTTIGFGHSFWHTLAFAQLIGMTICTFVLAAVEAIRRHRPESLTISRRYVQQFKQM